jgi:O-antigen/teichoic acid export membrane protein
VSTAEIDAAVPGGARMVAMKLVQYVALFAANVVVARALGPSERAQYALPLALMAVVLVVVDLSIDQASGRALARRQASLGQLFGVAAATSVAFGLVGAGSCLLIGSLVSQELLAGASFAAVALAAAALPFALAAKTFGGLLLRAGRLGAFGAVNAASGALQLAGVVLLQAGPGLNPERALAVFAVATAMLAAGSALFVRQEVRRRNASVELPPRRVFGRLLRDGLMLQGASIGLFLMFRIDLLLVAALTSARQVGLYSLAASLAEIVFVAAITLAQTGLHRITEEPAGVAARFTAVFTRRVVIIGAAAGALVAAASYPGIPLLYGEAWRGSVTPLAILAGAAVAITLAAPVQAYLVREGRLRDISVIALGSLAANIVLNLALIPLLGIAGAAIASLVTYWGFGLLLTRQFRRLAVSLVPDRTSRLATG